MEERLWPVDGLSMRVRHPLGWTFEAVGPRADVRALWLDWLAFLRTRTLGMTLPDDDRIARLRPPEADPGGTEALRVEQPRRKRKPYPPGTHWMQKPENAAKLAEMREKAAEAKRAGQERETVARLARDEDGEYEEGSG